MHHVGKIRPPKSRRAGGKESEGNKKSERGGLQQEIQWAEREIVCLCVCVCVREREREFDYFSKSVQIFSTKSDFIIRLIQV